MVMNYIDEMLQHLDTMGADDIIQKIGGSFYNKGIGWDEILKYPKFIQDIMFLIDLDTSLAIDGDVLINRLDLVPNMISALKNIGADNESALLQRIYDEYILSLDYEKEKANEIWDGIINDLYNKMYFTTGFDIWGLLNDYVECEKEKT